MLTRTGLYLNGSQLKRAFLQQEALYLVHFLENHCLWEASRLLTKAPKYTKCVHAFTHTLGIAFPSDPAQISSPESRFSWPSPLPSRSNPSFLWVHMAHFVLAAIMVLITLHYSQLVTCLSTLRDCELLEDSGYSWYENTLPWAQPIKSFGTWTAWGGGGKCSLQSKVLKRSFMAIKLGD